MIINSGDKCWNEYINRLPLPKQDIYYTAQYYEMNAQSKNVQPQLFVYNDIKGNFGIYPFLKYKIVHTNLKGIFYDIESAYGYGGPIISCEDEEFRVAFEQNFIDYCCNAKIIAEFVRFHPLIKNESVFRHDINVEHNRTTIWIDLTKPLDEIWMQDISTKNRNIIRKCEKNGLLVERSDNYEEFIQIYNETMNRVGAGSFYYFENKYYELIRNNKQYILFNVKEGSETIAAAIFMRYGDYFHYHLSGSRKEKLKLSPNNILLWEAIKFAKKSGYKKMHFGGGLTNASQDSLFRFKRNFSEQSADFYIGKRIHNLKVYDQLINDWEKLHGKKAKLFLQYRENDI